MEQLLEELTSSYGTSGNEEEIANLIAVKLSKFGDTFVDNMNNVKCSIVGKGKKILLDAHIDQIGFVVTAIDSDGFLKVEKVGGIDRRILLSREVTVWGNERLFGVISCQPPHLLNGDAYKKTPDFSDISIDIGMNKEQAEKLVSVGDRVTLKYQSNKLLNNNVSMSFLDDRSGVAAILKCLEILKNKDINANLLVAFSSQEEVGTRGAKTIAFDENVDEAIAIDVSFALTPDSDKYQCGKLGNGAMIGIAPTLSKTVYSKLIEVAKKNNINHQLEVMGGSTGTNADVIGVTGSGVQMGLISIPLKYMHTPIETTNINDIQSVAQLLACYIEERVGECDE